MPAFPPITPVPGVLSPAPPPSPIDGIYLGPITAPAITSAGAITGVTGSFSGTLSAAALVIAAGLTAASGTFSGAVAAKLYDAGAIGARTWSGANNIGMTPFIEAGTGGRSFWTGTVSGNMGAPAGIGLVLATGSSIDASATGGVSTIMSNLEIDPGHKGGASVGNLGFIVYGNSETAPVEYVVMRYVATGGNPVSFPHALIGTTTQLTLVPNATGYAGTVGAEYAFQWQTGSSGIEKVGTYAMLYTGDVVQGSANDCAYGIWSQYSPNTVPGTTGLKVGLQFGHVGGLFSGISTTGAFIKVQPNSDASTITADAFIDADALNTATTGYLRFLNFRVDGTGKMRIGATGAPTIRSGAGIPASTEPNGSLYMRTDGAANTRFYISAGGGTWAAVTSA